MAAWARSSFSLWAFRKGPASPSSTPCGYVSFSGAPYAPSQIINGVVNFGNSGGPTVEYAFLSYNQNNNSGTWYVAVNGQWIGYTNFQYTGQMVNTAATYRAGGEVYDSWTNNKHTATWMGSGLDGASFGFGSAAWDRTLYYVNCATSSNCYNPVSYLLNYDGYNASHWYRYNTKLPAGNTAGGDWNEYFYFGGGYGAPY